MATRLVAVRLQTKDHILLKDKRPLVWLHGLIMLLSCLLREGS